MKREEDGNALASETPFPFPCELARNKENLAENQERNRKEKTKTYRRKRYLVVKKNIVLSVFWIL